MKGFPNQIADISKLTIALYVLAERIDKGLAVDDDSYGESLLRQEVIQPGRGGETIDQYLARMRINTPSNQSHRTTGRQLKEFFRITDLIIEAGEYLELTEAGELLLSYWSTDGVESWRDHWRSVANNIALIGGSGAISHPYRIMLRLLAERPGSPRAFCALALEAQDDSEEEFQRILGLRDLADEQVVLERLGISTSSWDNAKKILPSIAEQIEDVARTQGGLYLVNGPTTGTDTSTNNESQASVAPARLARRVTSTSIASTKAPEHSDEGPETAELDLISLAEAIAKRANRNHRHNQLVQQFAAALKDIEELWEGDFDCLTVTPSSVILAEMKTLDGTHPDEVRQVRSALSQLRYYETFSIPESVAESMATRQTLEIAVFDSSPSEAHKQWLESVGITVVWSEGSGFTTTTTSRPLVLHHLRLDPG